MDSFVLQFALRTCRRRSSTRFYLLCQTSYNMMERTGSKDFKNLNFLTYLMKNHLFLPKPFTLVTFLVFCSLRLTFFNPKVLQIERNGPELLFEKQKFYWRFFCLKSKVLFTSRFCLQTLKKRIPCPCIDWMSFNLFGMRSVGSREGRRFSSWVGL